MNSLTEINDQIKKEISSVKYDYGSTNKDNDYMK